MNGILIINKPEGLTSHQVINRIKRILNVKKIGHAGTLDPMATGVLIVLLNDATKLSDYLMADDKIYEAGIAIGSSTDTEDSMGTTLSEKQVEILENVDQVLAEMVGKQEQIPPMYSAIKQDGKKLYELARQGKEVKREGRQIEILSLTRNTDVTYNNNHAYFSYLAHVSKGTYIRTLCLDIGKKFGFPAHMNSLVRIRSGKFDIKDSYTIEDVEAGNFKIISLLEAIDNYYVVELDDELFFKVRNGQKLATSYESELVAFKKNDDLIAIYRKEDNVYKAERVWN